MKFLIYDIETLKNLATFCFLNKETGQRRVFHVFENETCEQMVAWLRSKTKDYYHVGYNNLAFDAQVIETIVRNPTMNAYDVYETAQKIIANKDDTADKELNRGFAEWQLTFKQVDIYKIKHFDSGVKRTSLKWIEFWLKQENVLEMPINHDKLVQRSDIPIIEDYCWNDVDTTSKAFDAFWEEIKMRFEISKEFGLDLINASEPRLAKTIYLSEMQKALGLEKWELKERIEAYRQEAITKTFKPRIIDWLQFEDPIFKGVRDKFANTVIDPANTKNVLSINYKWRNIELYHGLGGLHGCVEPGVYRNDEMELLDIDFTSYYPFIKIRNGIYPPYYGPVYLEKYEGFFHKRKKYPKGHSLNTGFKIVLNASYGLLNEYNSPLYFPEGAMFVTVNGQLILLYMLEQLAKAVPELFVVQCNTDGITIMFYKENREKVDTVLAAMEEKTQIGIETVDYKAMFIRDVNNYIAIDTNGKAKLKGTFEIKKDAYKDHSFLIVPMALEAYFVRGQDYKQFILDYPEIWPFLGAVKKKSNFAVKLVDLNFEQEQQRITRYFVAKKGGSLIKVFDGKKGKKSGITKVESGWKVKIANKIETADVKQYDINHLYYIKEAEKIVFLIEGNNSQLKLF